LAPAAQLFSLLASVEDRVVDSFRGGGGVSPDAYERLTEMMAAEKRQLIDESYVQALVELAPGMHERLIQGASVLDIGCGDGAILSAMARAYPRSSFRGYDLSHAAIRAAVEHIEEAELDNVELSIGDVVTLDQPRAYDLVLALESIHEMGFPRIVLRRIVAALKHDGVFVMQEMAVSSHLSRNLDHPVAPMLYALSTMHAVPMALGQEGEALGRMWGEERAMQLLAEAGFRSVRFEKLAANAMSYYCVASK
jgi:2-polyprenyl-3-methyl-5-hydroxy-6-metoxy-1,4-benzoquinol methylase